MQIQRFKDGKTYSFMVRVTEDEALALIVSLATQLKKRSPNVGRLESYTKDGQYFSIAVHPEKAEDA